MAKFEDFVATATAMGGNDLSRGWLKELWEGADSDMNRAINHLLDTPEDKYKRESGGGGGGGGEQQSKHSSKMKKEHKSSKRDHGGTSSKKSSKRGSGTSGGAAANNHSTVPDLSSFFDFPQSSDLGQSMNAPAGMAGISASQPPPAQSDNYFGQQGAPINNNMNNPSQSMPPQMMNNPPQQSFMGGGPGVDPMQQSMPYQNMMSQPPQQQPQMMQSNMNMSMGGPQVQQNQDQSMMYNQSMPAQMQQSMPPPQMQQSMPPQMNYGGNNMSMSMPPSQTIGPGQMQMDQQQMNMQNSMPPQHQNMMQSQMNMMGQQQQQQPGFVDQSGFMQQMPMAMQQSMPAAQQMQQQPDFMQQMPQTQTIAPQQPHFSHPMAEVLQMPASVQNAMLQQSGGPAMNFSQPEQLQQIAQSQPQLPLVSGNLAQMNAAAMTAQPHSLSPTHALQQAGLPPVIHPLMSEQDKLLALTSPRFFTSAADLQGLATPTAGGTGALQQPAAPATPPLNPNLQQVYYNNLMQEAMLQEQAAAFAAASAGGQLPMTTPNALTVLPGTASPPPNVASSAPVLSYVQPQANLQLAMPQPQLAGPGSPGALQRAEDLGLDATPLAKQRQHAQLQLQLLQQQKALHNMRNIVLAQNNRLSSLKRRDSEDEDWWAPAGEKKESATGASTNKNPFADAAPRVPSLVNHADLVAQNQMRRSASLTPRRRGSLDDGAAGATWMQLQLSPQPTTRTITSASPFLTPQPVRSMSPFAPQQQPQQVVMGMPATTPGISSQQYVTASASPYLRPAMSLSPGPAAGGAGAPQMMMPQTAPAQLAQSMAQPQSYAAASVPYFGGQLTQSLPAQTAAALSPRYYVQSSSPYIAQSAYG
ncbi:unnamed protein product [Amoebophrya sp. A120]|nr:unnamed protein product [Amoebophrya sp. A120]|eukprot:GSA120T00012896001.1